MTLCALSVIGLQQSVLERREFAGLHLSFLGNAEYRALEGQVVEVKRMLSGFVQRLRTENRGLGTDD